MSPHWKYTRPVTRASSTCAIPSRHEPAANRTTLSPTIVAACTVTSTDLATLVPRSGCVNLMRGGERALETPRTVVYVDQARWLGRRELNLVSGTHGESVLDEVSPHRHFGILVVAASREDVDLELAQHLGQPRDSAVHGGVWDHVGRYPRRRVRVNDAVEVHGDAVLTF